MSEGDGSELVRRTTREAAAGLSPIRRALTVAGVGAVVGLTTVTIIVLAALGFPRLAPHGALSVSDLLDVLKLVLGTVAGVGALAALVLNYRKQRLAEVAEIREHHRAGDERVRVFNERFATAAGQLGNAEAAVRLAGVYAMAGLADDWEHGRQTCIDVLCAYLRMPYEPDPGQDAPASERLAFGRFQEVRHTVIDVVAAHLHGLARTSWRGCDFSFAGVRFDGGDFTGVKFSDGVVSFAGAEFSDGRVLFTGAEFSGGVVLFDAAKFSGGHVFFTHATFSGGQVAFDDAEFSGGRVSFDYSEFSGGDVSFTEAGFSGGQISFDHAEFSGGGPPFDDMDFTGGGASFTRAEFSGGRLSFTDAAFLGGYVDLSETGSWPAPPPLIGVDTANPPEGLLLPPGAVAPPGESGSA